MRENEKKCVIASMKRVFTTEREHVLDMGMGKELGGDSVVFSRHSWKLHLGVKKNQPNAFLFKHSTREQNEMSPHLFL